MASIPSLTIGTSAMKAFQTGIQTIADNIANISSSGFKSSRTEYSNNLYAGGDFTFVNGTTTSAHYVAKWDGTTWSPLGTAVNSFVYSMVVYNGELYIGGNFTTAGGNPANYIAKWNGTSWAALGSGLNNKVYSKIVNFLKAEMVQEHGKI